MNTKVYAPKYRKVMKRAQRKMARALVSRAVAWASTTYCNDEPGRRESGHARTRGALARARCAYDRTVARSWRWVVGPGAFEKHAAAVCYFVIATALWGGG